MKTIKFAMQSHIENKPTFPRDEIKNGPKASNQRLLSSNVIDEMCLEYAEHEQRHRDTKR